MALLAQGLDYFGAEGFPLTVRRVQTEPGGRPSHAHDVTEIDHYHDFCELVLVLSGRGLHVLEQRICGSGTASALLPRPG